MSETQCRVSMKGYKRITLEEMDDRGVQNLIEGIIAKAADDFLWGCKMEQKHPGYHSELKRDAEEYFLSPAFAKLTGLDGVTILQGLKRKAGMKK